MRLANGRPRLPFVGRTTELETLHEGLTGIRDGRLGVVLVEGEAGIGKTRTIAQAVDRLPAEWTVVAGSGDELERTRPFGALAAALGVVPSSADPERAAVARLLFGDRDRPGAAATGEQRYLLVEELLSLVERAALRRPLVLVLDDLQWVDDGTLLVLRELAVRLADLPVAILGGVRAHPLGAHLAGTLAVLAEVAGAVRVVLPPLDPEEVTALVGAVAGGVPGARLAEKVAGARANPLYVTELILALERQGAVVRDGDVVEVDAAVMPASLRATVLRRIGGLSAAALELLRLGAVLGRRFDVVELSAVSGRSPADLAGTLGATVDAGVLEPAEDRQLAFRHALVRDAIYEDIPVPVRAALHLQVARALADAGAPALTVAHHMAIGGGPGDRDAVRWLHEAARQADPRAPEIALELAQRALAIAADDDPLRGSLIVLTTGELVWAGALDRAMATVEDALAAGRLTGAEEADLRAQLAWAAFLAGRPDDAARITEEALARPAPEDRRRFQLQQVAYGLLLRGDPGAADELARQVVDAGTAAGDDAAVSGGLRVRASILLALGEVREAIVLASEAIARARTAGGPALRWAVGATLVQGLFEAGRFAEASRALADAREEAHRHGVTWVLPMYHWFSALLCYLTGRPDDALAEAQAGFDLAEQTGVRHGCAAGHAVLALVAVERNDEPRGREQVVAGETVLAAGGFPLGGEWLLLARARVEEAAGDRPAARGTLVAGWQDRKSVV